MKTIHLFQPKYILCILTTVLWHGVSAQSFTHTVSIDPNVAAHHTDAINLINNLPPIYVPNSPIPRYANLIAGYAFNDSLHRFFNVVSGTVIKSGQIQSTSTVLDDKSLTVNYTIPFSPKSWFSVQPTITGSSSKGIINLFTGDKYAKTLTGGVNLNFFITGGASFPVAKRREYIASLKDSYDNHSLEFGNYRSSKQSAITDLIDFRDNPDNDAIFNGPQPADQNAYTAFFIQKRTLHDLLDKLTEFYPEKMDTTDMAQVNDFITDLRDRTHQDALLDYSQNSKELKLLDSLQKKAPFSKFTYWWLTFSPKYNRKDYPIYDAGNAADSYTKTKGSAYFSATGSLNFLFSWSKTKLLVYPGITIQNARAYKATDSITLNIEKPFIVGSDSLKTVKSTGFYLSEAAHKWSTTINLPVMFYWSSGQGIDAGINWKTQKENHDFNAHIGFFFTVPTSAASSLVLEPVLKYENDKMQTYARNSDKFTLGFSVSFALPAYISGK